MKIPKLYLYVLVLLLPIISNAATLTLSPSSNTVSVNGTFTVNIVLDTTGTGTYGVDVNRLRFNPAILQVVDSDTGTSGVQISAGSLMPVTTLNSVDNVGGTIQFSQLANFGSTFTGSGTFATITFRGVGAGNSSVTMDFTNGSGTDSNVAGLGSDLLTSVGSGSYTVNALDTTAPTLSAGSPSGSLVYTTTSVTMSVTTNENATCRFSASAGTAYASMVSTFSTTGGTSHSTSITGLTSGNTYTRYIRCQDSAGNSNSADYIVTFSVANVPDTTPPTISAISASSITSSGATISWTTNETSDTQVDYGLTTAYGQSSALNSTLVTSHTVNLTGLSPNTTYNFRVKSRDGSSNLATGANQTFSTLAGPDTIAPSVPTGLSATPVSISQINLSWTASTDTASVGQTASGVAGYQVWRGGVFIATTTTASYSNTGLSSATLYSYQVASFDNAGNISSRTTSVSATTQSPTPVQRSVTLILEGTGSTQRNVSGNVQFIDSSNTTVLGQSSITTNTSGQVTFTLPLGLPSSIRIRPNITGYLARFITGVDTTSSSVLSFTSPSLPAGDFNGDQIINSLDFSSMNSNWLASNSLTDVNKDGIVNSLDFAYMSNNWLAVGQ